MDAAVTIISEKFQEKWHVTPYLWNEDAGQWPPGALLSLIFDLYCHKAVFA
jgi:hypothetical protein